MENKAPKQHGHLAVLAMAAIMSLVAAITSVVVYDRWFAQKIVTIDLKTYLRAQRDRLAAGEIDDDGLLASLDVVDAKLNGVPSNHVVILKDVVLRNARQIDLNSPE